MVFERRTLILFLKCIARIGFSLKNMFYNIYLINAAEPVDVNEVFIDTKYKCYSMYCIS